MDHGRLEAVPQFVVNPEDTAFSNLTSTCTNTQALNLHPVYLSADVAMEGVAAAATGDEERLWRVRQSVRHDDAKGAAVLAAAAGADADISDAMQVDEVGREGKFCAHLVPRL
jgi:hypothetical protein